MRPLEVISLMFIAFSLGMMVGQMSADKRFRELSCYMDDDVLRVGVSRELGEEVVLNGIVITRDGPYALGGEVIFDAGKDGDV